MMSRSSAESPSSAFSASERKCVPVVIEIGILNPSQQLVDPGARDGIGIALCLRSLGWSRPGPAGRDCGWDGLEAAAACAGVEGGRGGGVVTATFFWRTQRRSATQPPARPRPRYKNSS